MKKYKKLIQKTAILIAVFSTYIWESPASNLNLLREETHLDAASRHLVRMYEQDPSVSEDLGIRTLIIPTKLDSGPSNDYMGVVQNPATPNEKGDFIFDASTDEFDSVHTFTVAWDTMRLCRQDLEKLLQIYPQKEAIKTAIAYWDSVRYGKLSIYPKDGPDDQNAYYSRYEGDDGKPVRELRFFSFDGEKGRVVTSLSLDVVAHEAGHSILDILHPEYFDNGSVMLGAFHEAYGDMTAMFVILADMKLCNTLYTHTRGDLSLKSFLTDMAEDFGNGIGSSTGLRNLLEPVTMQTAGTEVHALSRVFTNAVYGILKDVTTKAMCKYLATDPGDHLIYQVGQHLRRMVLQTLLEVKKKQPTFSDFAFKMYDIAMNQPHSTDQIANLKWAKYISRNFASRGIPVEENSRALDWINKGDTLGAKLHICGTVHKHCKLDKE
jgi:hypothetical protein